MAAHSMEECYPQELVVAQILCLCIAEISEKVCINYFHLHQVTSSEGSHIG